MELLNSQKFPVRPHGNGAARLYSAAQLAAGRASARSLCSASILSGETSLRAAYLAALAIGAVLLTTSGRAHAIGARPAFHLRGNEYPELSYCTSASMRSARRPHAAGSCSALPIPICRRRRRAAPHTQKQRIRQRSPRPSPLAALATRSSLKRTDRSCAAPGLRRRCADADVQGKQNSTRSAARPTARSIIPP